MKKSKELMEKQKESGIFAPVLNHRPITRRDFLAQGYISSVGMLLAPTMLSMLASRKAMAACAGDGVQQAGKTPVIIFDLAGGANFAGSNVMVGKAGGQMDYLADYARLGLPSGFHPSNAGMTTTINGQAAGSGLLFHNNSDLLIGMQRTAGTSLQNTDGMIFAAASGDDTSNNPHNPAYWLYRAGARGELVQVIGSRNSESGGRSVVPTMSYDASVASVQVRRPQDATGLVQLGALGNLFSETKVAEILRAAENTSGRKLASFNQLDISSQIQELVNCGFIESKSVVGRFTADALDPTQDANVNAAFANMNGNRERTATIAKLVLDGYAGVGSIELGGYDYHGQGRDTQAQKDQNVGELIGSVLQLAQLKNKDVMIYVLTDGGVSANTNVDNSALGNGRFDFSSDSGSRSSSLLLVHKNDGPPTMRDATRQVGAFQDNGAAVNRSFNQISNNVTNLAKAVVANYMALHGEEGGLSSVVGNETISADMNAYVKFTQLR